VSHDGKATAAHKTHIERLYKAVRRRQAKLLHHRLKHENYTTFVKTLEYIAKENMVKV
jgi:hypothetical protein